MFNFFSFLESVAISNGVLSDIKTLQYNKKTNHFNLGFQCIKFHTNNYFTFYIHNYIPSRLNSGRLLFFFQYMLPAMHLIVYYIGITFNNTRTSRFVQKVKLQYGTSVRRLCFFRMFISEIQCVFQREFVKEFLL